MKTRYWILFLISTLLFGISILPLIEYVDYHVKVMKFEDNCRIATEGKQWQNPPVCIWPGGSPETPQLQILVDEFFHKCRSWCYEPEN